MSPWRCSVAIHVEGARLRVVLLALLLAYTGCVVSDCYPTVGNSCIESFECEDSADLTPNVCVPLDPDDPEGELICAPAVVLPLTSCDDEEDCINEGFPVDVACDDNICTCDDLSLFCELGVFEPKACGCLDSSKGPGESCSFPGECFTAACTAGQCSDTCQFDGDCLSGNCDEGAGFCL